MIKREEKREMIKLTPYKWYFWLKSVFIVSLHVCLIFFAFIICLRNMIN